MTAAVKTLRSLILVFMILSLMTPSARAIEKCMICHGKSDLSRIEATGRVHSLLVDEKTITASVHKGKICTDCHIDVVAIPHQKPGKVNCRRCHYYGNPVGAPEGRLYDQYDHSVHGLEVAAGNPGAPVCQNCHGGHDIFSPDSALSSINIRNIPQTCGRCHIDIFATYRESIHGRSLENGNVDAPVCSSCHGEHNIASHNDPESRVYGGNVTSTCSDCHGPLGVAEKYGIKTDRTATFEDSFHGVAQMMGSRMVANCSSCHGVHDIRSGDDPKSRIHPANIPTTCGRADCHPEATTEFASGTIHVDPKSEESGLLYYISKGFMILTVSTMAVLFAFILLDLYRRGKAIPSRSKENNE